MTDTTASVVIAFASELPEAPNHFGSDSSVRLASIPKIPGYEHVVLAMMVNPAVWDGSTDREVVATVMADQIRAKVYELVMRGPDGATS